MAKEFPARIAAALRQRQGDAAPPVINAGIGNSGNGYWIKFLRLYGDTMEPRLVVMQVFANDFQDNVREGLFTVGSDGSLLELAIPAPGSMRRLQGLIEAIPGASQSYLVGLLRQALSGRGAVEAGAAGTSDGAGAREDDVTLAILRVAIASCQARGWPVLALLVGLPASRQNAVAALFEQHGARTVVIPAQSERPDLYYKVDGHWHAGGHAFVADRLLEALAPVSGRERGP